MARQIYLSALHKSSGKTSVAIGICAALAQQGLRVQPFKKGPDYIDPGWLTLASGRPCHNLDFHTMEASEIVQTLVQHGSNAEFCLLEGTKGLHDGVDPQGADSNAALAGLIGAPVVLVVDCRGMSRGIAPLLLGQAAFEPGLRISGVILNRVGGARHEAKLRAAIEGYTDIPVLGALADSPSMHIEDPYLGLVPADEQAGARAVVQALAARIGEGIDLAALRQAGAALPSAPSFPNTAVRPANRGRRVRIAVARDRAFNFYYPGDLQALEAAGAELVFFDAIHDRRLPAADGIFIGGGFPERHAAALEANTELREAVRRAAGAGTPIYAECGGLIYLARTVRGPEGTHTMAGVLPVDVVMEPRPQGRGYVRLAPTGDAPWSPVDSGVREIPAHEFHYSRLLQPVPKLSCAYRMLRGEGIGNGWDGIVAGNTVASYAHLRHTRATPWATKFVDFVTTVIAGAYPSLRAERSNLLDGLTSK